MGDRIVGPGDVLTKSYVEKGRLGQGSDALHRSDIAISHICREDGRTELKQILVRVNGFNTIQRHEQNHSRTLNRVTKLKCISRNCVTYKNVKKYFF